MTKVAPRKEEGRDGDHMIVEQDGVVWSYRRVNGRWMKVRMEDG